MAKTAVRPDFFSQFPSIKKDMEAQSIGATEEERKYYGMSLTSGWVLFKQMADTLIQELDQLNDKAIENGATFEELGKNSVVISQTKGIIKKLLDKVEDSKEACERSGQLGGN